MPIVFLDNIFK